MSEAEDRSAVKRLLDKAVDALNTGDPDSWAALYEDDAIVMPPNVPEVVGKEGARSFIRDLLAPIAMKLSSETLEVEVLGDWAFVRGTFMFTATPKAGGEAISDNGHHILLYKRQPDGSWKTARHIWNSEQPLSGGGSKAAV